MAMNPDTLLGSPPIRIEQNWKERNSILYALGVGSEDLDFVYEEGLKALPTMAVVLGYPGFIWQNPEWNVDWKKVLHGEQSIVIHKPFPAKGQFIGETRITKLIDKGAEKGAIAMVERRIVGGDGTHYSDVIATIFLRGDGGFGGSPDGAPVPHKVPIERAPDLTVDMPTAKNSAMIYRLSGDFNPLLKKIKIGRFECHTDQDYHLQDIRVDIAAFAAVYKSRTLAIGLQGRNTRHAITTGGSWTDTTIQKKAGRVFLDIKVRVSSSQSKIKKGT